MPDKIKEVYESTKDIGLFLDEKDFRDLVSRDPKGVFDIYSKDKNYKDFFLDYNDFENTLGLKKKVQLASGETSFSQPFKATTSTGERISSTDSPSPLKPQRNTPPSVFIEEGKPIDVKSGLSKSLRQQAKESEDFGVAPAIAAEEFKLEGEKRKNFIGETTSNIYSSVIEPNIDLFVSQKDQPTMYGTKKIPAGTVNTDAVYDAVDAYAEKYKEKTGEELDKEARQAIAVGLTDQIKSRDKKFKAAALIDIYLKSQNLPTLSQLNIQAQDRVNKVKGLVEEKNNFIKAAIKNPDKQIMGEATSEVDMLKTEIKSQADRLNAESQGFYESTFNAELQPVIRQYQQLVDTRQMTPEQANSELKAAAEGLSEKIKQDTNARYAPMYDELNSAAKQKSIEIQTKYNRKLQDKIKSQLSVFDKNIDALIKESDNLPPNYKKSVEEASKKAYGYLFKEEEAQKLQNFRNLNIGEKIGRAWETGLADVLSTVGGAINMTGFDAQGINELSLKAEQLTGVPSAAWSDKDVMDSFTDLDWWIVNGVRSLPFTVFTMPTGIVGGRLFGTLASALNATKRAQMISSVVGGGIIGWEAERLLEAGGSYKEAIDNGMSREEAARIAKDSMDLQLSTLPMNIAQMLPFFCKGFKFMKVAGIEAVAGYMEEVQQGWAGQRAKNLAEDKEQRGIGEAVNSFGNYFFSKEALQEGVIGAAVGQAMTVASLTNTPDIDLQINSIMSSLSVGGESQARKMLEIMAKNGAISEAELKEYSNLIDYTLEGIAQTENFPVSDSIKASLVNKYVGLLKARALVTDDDNSLATQAAAELVQEKEKEIKNILKGTEPVYLVFPKGSDIPIVSTKEQVEQILKRPEYLEAFDIEIHNDQPTQAKLDEVNAAIETEKNKQNIQEEESGKKFYQGREFMEATGLKPDYYTQEEVDAAMEARGSKTEATALEETQPISEQESKASEPSKSDKNYQEAQEVSSIVSKENPDASVLIQPKGDNLSLTAVYVGKENRGKGIGTKVLESVKKQADRLGKKVVLDATNELDSETDLERLGNFYEKNGFKKVGENKYEYEPKAKVSSRDIGSRADTGGTKKSDISTDINKGQPSKKFDSTEEAVSESQAEALLKEQESAELRTNEEELKNYNGIFNPNKTGISGLDDLLKDDGYNYFYKGVSGNIVMMSPDEYLKKVRTDITRTDRDEGVYEEKKERIIEGINRGDKINMPYLSLKEDGKAHKQEGRNRATVAKEMGEKLIPVFIEKDISFDDKIAKGQEYINAAIKDGATTKEEVLSKLKEQGLHRDAIRFIDNNFDNKAVEQSLKETQQAKSQAEALPTEEKSQAKPVQEVPANIQEIADAVGENPNKVQNIYNKYGDKTKDVSEITQEDYDKAVKARETSKSKIKMAAIQSKLRQENLSEMEKKAEAKVLKMLKEKDYNQVKEVEDFMKLLPDLQKALLESGEIKTIDCKWGK